MLLEHQSGWIEVIVGEETKKDRLRNFIAVPSSYLIGDTFIEEDTFCEEVASTAPSSKENQSSAKSISAEKKFRQTIGTVFYWYCELCCIPNPFIQEACIKCKRERKHGIDSFGKPSALLELVENICATAVGAEAIRSIPPIQRRSIPPQVIDAVVIMSRGSPGGKAKVLNMSTLLPIDSVFYWQCLHCTMENSFRRWSCNTCKRKVRNSYVILFLPNMFHNAHNTAFNI